MLFPISERFVMDLTYEWGTVSRTFSCLYLGYPNFSFNCPWIDAISSELLAASFDKLKTNLPVDSLSLQTRLCMLTYCITIRIYPTVWRSDIDSCHWLHCSYVITVICCGGHVAVLFPFSALWRSEDSNWSGINSVVQFHWRNHGRVTIPFDVKKMSVPNSFIRIMEI